MDMTASIEARSDQINADDLIGGPMLVTISEVVQGKADQPFDFKLVEHPKKAYRPNKSMRRVLVALWGSETSPYAGRQLVLYREPTVKWAGEPVGGIRISHASHIAEQREVWAQTTRGHRERFVIEPLATQAPPAEEQQPMASSTQGRMFALFTELKITDENEQRAGMARVLGREVQSRGGISEAEGRQIVAALEARKSSGSGAPSPAPEPDPEADR
jgi:hypothetical protein